MKIDNVAFADKPTKESHDKLQAQVNAERDALLATMPPETKEKFEKIHQAASILDGAKIPFLLIGDPGDDLQFMQYNQLCYKYEVYSKEYLDEAAARIGKMHELCSKIYSGAFPYNTISYSWPDGRIFLQIDRNGRIVPPPEFFDKEIIPALEEEKLKNSIAQDRLEEITMALGCDMPEENPYKEGTIESAIFILRKNATKK